MSYPINYPTPQGANVQIFRGGNTFQTSHTFQKEWVKPQGASFVWFTLIGAGGGGGGGMVDNSGPAFYAGGGGGSGNVTNFMCPAFLLPDVLQVMVGAGGNGGSSANDTAASNGTDGEPTRIYYQQKTGTGYQLLVAAAGIGGSGAAFGNGSGGTAQAADIGGPMTAAGFYNSTGGQNGANGNITIGAPGLTFVMGGTGGYFPTTGLTGYYGYTAKQASGYSQLSPIPVSMPCSNDLSVVKGGSNSFGCGGNGGGNTTDTLSNGGRGGDGLAIIVTW